MADPAPGAPYHRLARTPATRWWRLPVGVIGGVALWFAGAFGFIELADAVHRPVLDDGSSDVDLVWEHSLFLIALAGLVPAMLLTARWVDRRPAGALSAVTGRLRLRWLARCSLVAAGIAAVLGAIDLAVSPPEDGGWSAVDWPLVAGIALSSVLLVPFQAAGEEYLFRGYLAQAIGAFVRTPWPPAIVLSLLFGLAHGTEQSVWAFADRASFGFIAAWLTIRTGGLEAAIAIHLAINVVGFVVITIDGDLLDSLSGFEEVGEPLDAALAIALTAAVALLLDRMARRRRLATTWSAPAQAGSTLST